VRALEARAAKIQQTVSSELFYKFLHSELPLQTIMTLVEKPRKGSLKPRI